MTDVRIRSWNKLQDQLFVDSWNPELGRFRSRLAFRGLSDAAYPLATTLERLGGDRGGRPSISRVSRVWRMARTLCTSRVSGRRVQNSRASMRGSSRLRRAIDSA